MYYHNVITYNHPSTEPVRNYNFIPIIKSVNYNFFWHLGLSRLKQTQLPLFANSIDTVITWYEIIRVV